jgi:hypothetical protein
MNPHGSLFDKVLAVALVVYLLFLGGCQQLQSLASNAAPIISTGAQRMLAQPAITVQPLATAAISVPRFVTIPATLPTVEAPAVEAPQPTAPAPAVEAPQPTAAAPAVEAPQPTVAPEPTSAPLPEPDEPGFVESFERPDPAQSCLFTGCLHAPDPTPWPTSTLSQPGEPGFVESFK